MKYLLSILCLFVLSCDDSYYPVEVESYTKYMMLVDGAIDVNQINPLGTTSSLGYLEYNNKASFPTLLNHSEIQMAHTDGLGNQLDNFQLDDLTQGEFNLILVDNSSGETYNSINTSLEPLTIDDRVNNFNIELLDNDNYSITHFISDGEFNLIFNISDEDGNPMENMDVFLQYVLDCNTDIFPWCAEDQDDFGNVYRPSTSFQFTVCTDSQIKITIELLDGTVIDETTDYYEANWSGYEYLPLFPSNLVTAGIQIFKYSIEFSYNHNNCNNYLSDNYPNPFN